MLKFVTDTLLSKNLKYAIQIAQAVAREKRNPEFTPAHLLKGLLHKDIGLLSLLIRLKKDTLYLEAWADANIECCAKASSLPAIAGDKFITDVMYEANSIRLRQLKDSIHPVHALEALITPDVGFNCEQMRTLLLRRDELIFSFAGIDNIEVVLDIGSKSA